MTEPPAACWPSGLRAATARPTPPPGPGGGRGRGAGRDAPECRRPRRRVGRDRSGPPPRSVELGPPGAARCAQRRSRGRVIESLVDALQLTLPRISVWSALDIAVVAII